MEMCQQCPHCSKTYSYLGAYTTHLWPNHKHRIVLEYAEQLPDDGFVIEHINIWI